MAENNKTPLAKSLIGKAERLKSDKSQTDAVMQEIRDLIYPSAAALTSKETPGTKQGLKVLDNTGEQASELLAAALFAGATPTQEAWAEVGAEDYTKGEDRDSDLWLERASIVVNQMFTATDGGFGPNQDEKLMDLVDFGTGCMFIGERPGHPTLFQARPIGECLLTEDEAGKVNANYRWYERTAAQIAAYAKERKKFPGEKVALFAEDPKKQEEKFCLLHATYARVDYDRQRADALNMPFASCWINVTEMHEIEESGFPEFPYAVPRWRKRAGEVYGRGPGHKALADVKMLQRGMQAQIRGVEKIVDPSLIAADDGIMSPVRLGTGKITYVRADLLAQGRSPIIPLQTGGRPDLGEHFLESVRTRIENAFFTHLIQFARDPKMTATQFLGITEQTQRVLSPILNRLQTEDGEPMVKRCLAIALRAGKLPPLPARLQGQTVRITYTSPMVKMQNVGAVKAAAETFDMLTPIATQRPDILDNYDLDKIAREVAMINGMRAGWLVDLKQVAATRKQRLQDAQAAANAQHAESAAKAAQGGAKALSLIRGDAAQGAAA